MFQGTIPAPMRSIVRETAGHWPRGPVYVPCCGNFTIERSLAGMGFALYSSDVSIYTSAVGRWLTRQPVGIQIRDESQDELNWLTDSLDDGVGTVATLMLGTRFLASVGREGLWHERVVRSYREQWKAKHAETVERLSGSGVELASYEVEDVRSWLKKVPRDAPVCSFPPFYCLAPHERILTSDLRWVQSGELAVGDEILAFDEHPAEGARCRRWRFATITRSEPGVKECVRVHLENGDSVVCTADHPWLADKYRHAGGGRRAWVRADRLMHEAPYVLRLLNTWEPERTYDAGWMAGMFDGEGSITLGSAPKLTIAQKAGSITDRVLDQLGARGFATSVSRRPNGVLGIQVAGGFGEALRALGTFRTDRLTANLRGLDITRLSVRVNSGPSRVRVVAVEPIGKQEIQSISTSSRTYIGEGYAMHNTGGYEKLYEPLEAHFTWDAPAYKLLSDADVVDVLGAITDRPHWLTASNQDVPELHEYLRGVIKATPRAAPFYVYASQARTRIVAPRQPIEPVHAPRLREGEELVGPLTLSLLKPGQFNALRSRYLNPRIAPGAANLAVAVRDGGGRLLGVFAMAPSTYTPDEAYVLSDFAVAPTDYPRLSKLIVLAATSAEAQLLCQRAFSRRIRRVATTAFSNNPVSMKYRGLLRLNKRSLSNEDGWKFQLQYQGAMGQHTLAEALDMWVKRWGAPTTKTGV
ncbi:Hint domain-containing protein [Streptomyces sp. NPDC057623]|uniref:Hint domain-containing protein n=1 Tax=Streptomyces sp. NPDC057623 TaxID=3346187 RepID=UPI0036C2C691